MRPKVLVSAAPIRKMSPISVRLVSAVGFSKGWAELALKKPPPSELSILIAICEATGPRAISCLPPSSDKIFAGEAKHASSHRRAIRLGVDRNNKDVWLNPDEGCVLISGSSGIGKSTLAKALTERMAEKAFQFCVFDPEGDYLGLERAVSEGDVKSPPNRKEALKLLRELHANVVVNTLALANDERPFFFAALFPLISKLRAQTGRPHWLFIDEGHHLLPAKWESLEQILPEQIDATILITVHPDALNTKILRRVRTLVALGESAGDVVATFCKAIGLVAPKALPALGEDEVLVYSADGTARPVSPDRPSQAHQRHTRKYAEGLMLGACAQSATSHDRCQGLFRCRCGASLKLQSACTGKSIIYEPVVARSVAVTEETIGRSPCVSVGEKVGQWSGGACASAWRSNNRRQVQTAIGG